MVRRKAADATRGGGRRRAEEAARRAPRQHSSSVRYDLPPKSNGAAAQRIESEILSYVGAPLQLPKIAEPTAAEIDAWHKKYMAALRELFDEHKAEAMPHRQDAQLEIW